MNSIVEKNETIRLGVRNRAMLFFKTLVLCAGFFLIFVHYTYMTAWRNVWEASRVFVKRPNTLIYQTYSDISYLCICNQEAISNRRRCNLVSLAETGASTNGILHQLYHNENLKDTRTQLCFGDKTFKRIGKNHKTSCNH